MKTVLDMNKLTMGTATAIPSTDGPSVLQRRLLLSGFVLSGFATPMLAALAPWLAQRHRLDPAQLGFYFTVQFFCSFMSSMVANRNAVLSIRLGFLSLAAGAGLLIVPTHWLSLSGAGLIGLGLGLVIPASNGICAYAGDSASRLMVLNLMWSVGALATSIVLRRINSLTLFSLGLLAFLCILHSLLWMRQSVTPAIQHQSLPPSLKFESLFALALFLYVGAENGIAGWAKLLCSPDPNNVLAAYALIGFTAFLLLGRLIAPWFTRRIPDRVLLFGCIALAVVCLALIQMSSSPLLHALAITISGLALAPMFPLIVSIFTKKIPQQRAWAFCASGLGGAILPWLMGAMSERIPLRMTYALPCLAFCAIFVLVRSLGSSPTARLRNFPQL